MYRPKDQQERILHRLKITKGHLEKVMAMVTEDAYCIDVIHQSQAIQKALKSIDTLILENHLKSCVTDAVEKGQAATAMTEVVEIFTKHNA